MLLHVHHPLPLRILAEVEVTPFMFDWFGFSVWNTGYRKNGGGEMILSIASRPLLKNWRYMASEQSSPERILELRALGLPYAQIAAEAGLSVSRVGELVRADERRRILETQKSAPHHPEGQ